MENILNFIRNLVVNNDPILTKEEELIATLKKKSRKRFTK